VKRAQPLENGPNDEGALKGRQESSDALNALKPPLPHRSLNEPPPDGSSPNHGARICTLLRSSTTASKYSKKNM